MGGTRIPLMWRVNVHTSCHACERMLVSWPSFAQVYFHTSPWPEVHVFTAYPSRSPFPSVAGGCLELKAVQTAVLKVIEDARDEGEDQPLQHLDVVDAFKMPKLKYDPDRHRFFEYVVGRVAPSLLRQTGFLLSP